MSYSHYNRRLKKHANLNRKKMTKAEASLWKYALKSGKRKGYKFKRQRPVDKYIADFMCKKLKLIIEVDGGTHNIEDINKNDIERQRKLEELGYKVIRFTDSEVLNNLNSVIEYIDSIIEEIE